MIHHVRGTLLQKAPGRVVLDLRGVGLELLVSDTTWRDLGAPGESVRLLTHLVVREDSWTLFGFSGDDERSVFRMLLGVQGVGPRVALAVLSGVSAGALSRAVQENDIAALTAVSGVGRKTAQRIVVDLRDKMGELPGAARVVSEEPQPGADEAVDALVALGYPRHLARDAVRGARDADPDRGTAVEAVVRDALRRI